MHQHGLPESGAVFENTPVSLSLLGCLATLKTASLFPPFSDSDILHYDVTRVLHHGEWWRILSSKLVFLETRDCLSCALLMFHFRSIERRFGSRTFLNHLIGHFVLTCSLEYLFIRLLSSFLPEYLPDVIPSGPFFVVYPLLQWFVREFPSLPKGSPSSDTPLVTPLFIVTIMAIDLFFAPSKIYFCLGSTLLAGALFAENFCEIKRLIRLPRWLFPRKSCEVNTRKMGASVEIQRAMQAEFLEQQMIYNSRIYRNNRNSSPPPEELISQLTEMGFSRDNAIQALQSTNNNVQMATNILLNQ